MKKFILSYSVYVFLFLSACVTEEKINRDYPRLSTNAVLEITEKGAQFSATFDTSTPEQVTSYGFIWAEDAEFKTGVHTITLDSLKDKNVYIDVHSTLVAKKIYYVRAFATTSSKTIYGNVVSFRSLGSEGPVITSLVPNPAAVGDTVTIVGRNFTGADDVLLTYEKIDISNSRVSVSEDKIRFIVPIEVFNNATEGIISVSLEGNVAKSPKPLVLDIQRMTPFITSITPLAVKACDTLTINGKNLKLGKFQPYLYTNDGTPLTILKASAETILCKVGRLPKTDLVFTVTNGILTTGTEKFDFIENRTQVISVSPLVYKNNDVITIQVKNFPACDDAVEAFVDATNDRLTFISKTSNEIKLQLPKTCRGTFKINLGVFDYNSYSVKSIAVTSEIHPVSIEVYSITPKHASLGDLIIISGKNLNQAQADILKVTNTSDTEIRGTLTEPLWLDDNVVDVYIYSACGDALTMPAAFTYDPVEIFDINPKTITSSSQPIIITGSNFSGDDYFNDVMIDNELYSATTSDYKTIILSPLHFLVPDGTSEVHKSYSNISIQTSNGRKATLAVPLRIDHDASWFAQGEFTGGQLNTMSYFTIGNKGYAGASAYVYGDKDYFPFFEYDPSTDTWTEKAPYPRNDDTSGKVSVSAGGLGYVGLGASANNEWWAYDPVADTWTPKADYPGGYDIERIAIAINGKVYVGGGSYGKREFYAYNPATDTWQRKADMPLTCNASRVSFSFMNKGYYYMNDTGGNIKECAYNPSTDSWSTRTLAATESLAGIGMAFNNFALIIEEQNGDEWKENYCYRIIPGSGEMQPVDFAGSPRTHTVNFVFGNIGYQGLGQDQYGNQFYDWWKFDPYKF